MTKRPVGHLETTVGGRIFSTTPGGTLAGIGATDIVLDDIMKPQLAHSADARQKLLNWFHSEVLNRFDNPADGVLIMVMHRLHPDDFSHSLEQSGLYRTIKLPLIAEEEEEYIRTGTKKTIFARQPGDILNPAHMTKEDVERIKKETPPSVFSARCQQTPVAAGAGLVKSEWFARYDHLPQNPIVFQSWDIATTQSAGDYSACTTWAYDADKFYLLDVFRKQIEFPDLRKAVRTLAAEFNPRLICIEAVGAGQALYQDLIRAGMKHLCPCLAKKKKSCAWKSARRSSRMDMSCSQSTRLGFRIS